MHHICIQDGYVALELAADYEHGEVVGVLIGAGLAAGQDVKALLGAVIRVSVGTGGGVLLGVCGVSFVFYS